MQVIKDNSLTKIYYTEDPELQAKVDDYLYMQLAEQVPGAEFSPQVKRGYWDGMVHFYDKKEHTFATGLCDDVVRLLDRVRFVYEFTYEVIDNRPDRFVDVDNLDPHLKTGGLELRDYQQRAVENVFKTNGGIVNLTVSGGKTLVGATIIDQIIPHLQKGERILFFTNNKEIFNQSIDNLNKFLDKPVGYLGAGKKKDAQVMVCMIPTMMSYLKIDPEAGLKFTEKERQVKKIAKTYAPMFMDGDNDYQKFRSYVNLYQPKKKVDEVTKEILEEIRDSVGNDTQLHNALTNYQDKYSKIVNKRAGDLVKKKKYGMDILESAVAFVADECLAGDTLVSMADGSYKRISDVMVGDNVKAGGKVSHLKQVNTETITLTHESGEITASPTHPIATYKEGKVIYKPVMTLKVGDVLLTQKPERHESSIDNVLNTQMGKVAYLVGMLYADGTFLSAHRKYERAHSNTVRVNISHKEQFSWYRKVFKEGILALCSEHGIDTGSVNIEDKLDTRGNLLLRVTNADVANVLFDTYKLPFGKKSAIIKTPKAFLESQELLLAFFSAVISCEGTVSKEQTNRVVIDMCSKRLINDMLDILNCFGIHGYYGVILGTGSHSTIYRATFTTTSTWKNIIPSYAPKANANGRDFNKRYKEDNGYVLSPIKDISFGEEETLYDLTTDTHVFIADGVLNHNCHHSKADTWYQVLLSCSNAIYKVGLTGTIDKEDPVLTTRLKGIFGGVVARVGASELIERNLLARPTIVMLPIKEPHNLASRSTKGPGAWQQIYKEGVVENKYRNTLIAAIVQRQFNSGSTILVIVNHIAQADIISSYLDELSIPHEFINGQQTSDQRKQELENVKEGTNQVLLATAVLDEGVDIANIDTLILAAGGKSTRQVVQRIGRVLRKKKGKENKATIFDFDDQTHKILRGHTKSRLAIYKEQGFEVKYAGK